jgi:hypothetical protein
MKVSLNFAFERGFDDFISYTFEAGAEYDEASSKLLIGVNSLASFPKSGKAAVGD